MADTLVSVDLVDERLNLDFDQLHSLRLVQTLARQWWGLELGLADAAGNAAEHAEGGLAVADNELCRLALASEEGAARCAQSLAQLGVNHRSREGWRVDSCHLGFDMISAPVVVGQELVGFLYLRGSLHRELDAGDERAALRGVRQLGAGSSEDDSVEREAEAAEDRQRWSEVPRMNERELEIAGGLIEYAAADLGHFLQARACTSAQPVARADAFSELIGDAPAMREALALLEKIARSESTVLIQGESGTGKELVARAIHFHGPRAKKAFVVQNCSAFNDNLLESALFGHVRGSFTGAVKDQKGLFEVADGGTFFLDEIGDMSPALQVKLLRVLQEGTLTPVGANKEVRVDVRIIAASHKDLATLVEKNQFREDLFYRVNVLKVTMPALRERLEDLPMLVTHFLRKHGSGKSEIPELTPAAMEALARYGWPGNIRELENEIERLMVLSGSDTRVGPELLSPRIRSAKAATPVAAPTRPTLRKGSLRAMVESVEAEVIAKGLTRTRGNTTALARELGVSRSNLLQKVNRYGLTRKD